MISPTSTSQSSINHRRSSREHTDISDESDPEDINYTDIVAYLGVDTQDDVADEAAGTPNTNVAIRKSVGANAEAEAMWAPGENHQDLTYADFGFYDSLALAKKRGVLLREEVEKGIEKEDEIDTFGGEFNSSFQKGLSSKTGQWRTGIRRGIVMVPTKMTDGKVRPMVSTKSPLPLLSNHRAQAA
mmetsp:Transcript_2309/g.3388  ORF Transcript_2309/g.3388 Transcript_2309/m.3388 type:complete len:186 (-) Transcript_2309:212-769(-)|eukprot:CAMPEP_0196137708 /NCGR_PEP_ID=MMETSP0910-20130528/5612_1 /TAXON_ID=49265 /ORGANISM="Thalassiosira rotula, Strain GSO102" /LENGTH=185 /DNA_ID=CAMNT_0041398209 /DNA_START=158 /DNA_END=715 /DNA_ORIENTATION=-